MESGLQSLIKKLNHRLKEIRIRALRNIISKLEYNLISENEVASNKQLITGLFEWFNEENDHEENKQVLMLLLKIVKNLSGAENVLNLGGVSFLTSLRNNSETSLQPLIDELLENLFKFPESSNIEEHKCQYEEKADAKDEGKQLSLELQVPRVSENVFLSDQLVETDICQNQINLFYGENLFEQNEISQCVASQNGFYFTFFPWVLLTNSDKHVLASAAQSLHNEDTKKISNLCDFLRNVIFQDFPSEIFLQRPQIFNTLLLLLDPAEDRSQVVFEIVPCLQLLTEKISSRIKFHWDPANYHRTDSVASVTRISTQETEIASSTDSRPPLIGQSVSRSKGDGENDSSSLSDDNSIAEDVTQLQLMQISVPEFCIRILNASTPLLQNEDFQIVTLGLQLINDVLDVVKISFAHVWSDRSFLALGVIDGIQVFFSSIGRLLQHHQEFDQDNGNSNNRHIYLSLLSISIRCLTVTSEPDQVSQMDLDKCFTSCLECALFDTSFRLNYPSLHSQLEKFVKQENANVYAIYLKTKIVCDAMEPACRLLSNNDSNDIELIEFARLSLSALTYLKNTSLITRIIQILSQNSVKDEVLERGRPVLLELLTHSSHVIRLIVYNSCLAVIKEILNITQASDTNLHSSLRLKFLCDSNVLKTLCIDGFNNSNAQVAEISREIVTYLMQSKLLIAQDVWNLFVDSISSLLPLIQAFADTRSTVGRAIGFFTQVNTSSLNRLELLRSSVRLLFHSDYRRRCETLQNIAWFLGNEEGSDEKIPDLYKIDLSSLPDLLVTKKLLNINIRITPSIYQFDHFKNVFNIVADSEMELSIRKSALEQISDMLEDPRFHSYFMERGGVHVLLNFIDFALKKQSVTEIVSNEFSTILSSCCASLLRLVANSKTLREELFDSNQIYLQLLRVAILHHDESQLHTNVSVLLSLLVFNQFLNEFESVPPPEGGDFIREHVFSLPPLIISRYKIPFHAIEEPTRSCEEETIDLWLIEPSRNMMRVAWNLCYQREMESSIWNLSSTEKQNIQLTNLLTNVEQVLPQINEAIAHKQVCNALMTLRLQITTALFHQQLPKLSSLPWRECFSRFLFVMPNSKADKKLLKDILKFLTFITIGNYEELSRDLRSWLSEILTNSKSVLYQILTADPVPASDNESKCLKNIVINLVTSIAWDLKNSTNVGNVVALLLRTLSVAEGAPHFYNLATLEATIRSLMHLTAKSGWSHECSEMSAQLLCSKVLSVLMDIVASFHVGHELNNYSLMGKGVTHSATTCLHHLVVEMSTQINEELWVQLWLSKNHTIEGFSWILPLWTFRDPEVRASSIGIAVGLASTSSGCHALMARLENIAGGIWGAAFTFLLDHNEASCVKEQAALLLINLTFRLISNDGAISLSMTDLNTQELLVGANALKALIHHSEFFSEISRLVTLFCPHSSLKLFLPESPAESDKISTNSSSADLDLDSSINARGETSIWNREVSTPSLIAAICKLLNNLSLLLPNETLLALKEFLMENLLKCLTCINLFSRFKKEDFSLSFIGDSLQMYSGIISVIIFFVKENPRNSFINSSFVSFLDNLLDLEFIKSRLELRNDVHDMWCQVYKLMTIIIQVDFDLTLNLRWSNVIANMQYILKNCQPNQWLYCFKFICCYCNFTNENQKQHVISLLDKSKENEEFTFGITLYELLFDKHRENCNVIDGEINLQIVVINSFSALLTASNTAKNVALAKGLIEFEMETLKDIYTQFTLLSLENVKISTGSVKKEKEIQLQKHLILHFDLLSALLFNFHDAKIECNEKGLSGILHQLWIWCRSSLTAMTSLLSLLCTYTANCKISVRSVAYTSPVQGSGVLKSLGTHSLVHALLRLAIDEGDQVNKKNDITTLVLVFHVLTNLCLGSECRSILCKANFLEGFTKLNNQKTKKSKNFQILEQLWLNLLISLTFAPDGQDAVFRTTGVYDTLLELAENGISSSLLALRNLVCSTNKSYMLNSDRIVRLLITCVVHGTPDNKAVSASALWALAANCQKVKMMLKNVSLMSQLQQAKTQVEKSQEISLQMTSNHLNNLFQIL